MKLFLFFSLCVFNFSNAEGQTWREHEWFLSEGNGGLCNESLVLFKDSSYCTEWGCEASSHFSFGTWTRKKNIIDFVPADSHKYNFISRVAASSGSENRLSVSFFDRQGVNITKWISAGQQATNGKLYSLDLDSTQTKRQDLIRPGGIIVLTSFQRLFNRQLEINTDSSTVFNIYLNISAKWNFHSNSVWDAASPFSLIVKDDKLISTRPDTFGDDGKITPKEYKRQ